MVQAAATPQLTVQYGSFTFDSTNGITLDASEEHFKIRDAYDSGFFSVCFSLRLTSPSNTGNAATDIAADNTSMGTLITNMVAALRKFRQRLRVKFGSASVIDWNPSVASNLPTAFHNSPQVEDISEDSSTRIRYYRFTLSVDHPSDLTGQNGRGDSKTQAQYTIRGRRVMQISASYTALNGLTALGQYQAATTNTWFTGQLPTPVANGEWVKQDDFNDYDDENATLNVTRTYIEVVNGLREYTISVGRSASQAYQITLEGFYTKTASFASAKACHDNFIDTFTSNTLAALAPGATFDAKPEIRQDKDSTTDEVYPFSRTYTEIVYNQGPSGADDANVVTFSLLVDIASPFPANTITGSYRPQALQLASAVYEADIDKNSSGGTDMKALWDSKFQAHCVTAIKSKLGATQVIIQGKDVRLSLEKNRLIANLTCLVRGNGDVISLLISEQITREVGGRPVPMASKKRHKYFIYDAPGSKRLLRVVLCEYYAGAKEPVFFNSGDTFSGIQLVDTGKSFAKAADEVENGTFTIASAPSPGGTGDTSGGGWYPEFAITPERLPSTIGDSPGIATVQLKIVERWLYMSELVKAPSASGGLTQLRTTDRSVA